MNNSNDQNMINHTKNRKREPYSFANINMLGKCNVNCFFCLGKDIEEHLCKHNQMDVYYENWENLITFFQECKENCIKKIYLTGQNTDPTIYPYLKELISEIQNQNFDCGIRTNGYLALEKMDILRTLRGSIGYSIHTLNTITNKMIMGRKDLPDWDRIIQESGDNVRVSIVLNRCNAYEFYDLLQYISKFKNVRYIQVRRVSSDTRRLLLEPDMIEYEKIYTQVKHIFPLKKRLWHDAEIYEIYGKDVVFWRTVKTSVNSMNYFTDGTISHSYFIVEGYLSTNKLELNA